MLDAFAARDKVERDRLKNFLYKVSNQASRAARMTAFITRRVQRCFNAFRLAHTGHLTPRKHSKQIVLCLLLTAICLLFLPIDAEAAIAFRIVGTLVGSFFGGPFGGLVGGLVGGLIGGALFPEKGQTIKGPRLDDKTVQSSAYGSHITKTWGTDRVPAQLIFSSGLKETKHKTEMGGKGMTPTQTSVTYTYSVDLMFSFGRRARGIKRLWFGPKLVYDVTGTANIKKAWAKEGRKFVVRDGNESQLPSALEESYHGAGLCSAHRGLFCVEFADLQLANFGNSVAGLNCTAEVFTEGDDSFGAIASYTAPTAPYSWWTGSWGYIDPNGEVWALYYPFSTPYPYAGYARIFHWSLDNTSDPIEEAHPLWAGDVVQSASTASYIRVRSDEPSAAVFGTNDSGIALSYFKLEEGSRVDVLQSEVPGRARPEILCKFGDEMYVVFDIGTPPAYLFKFNAATGVKLAESDVINATLSVNSVTDMARSESFLWVLHGQQLLKIDPDTLALISQIDLSPTIAETVLAMHVVSDSEIRFVNANASGTRFWIVENEGTPVLDQHDPTKGYASVRGFGRWGLRMAGGMYVVDFGGYIGGFQATIDFFAPSAETHDIALWKIVRDINIMSGLDSVIDTVPPTAGDIVVGDLTDMVHGYSLTRAMTARDALVQLQQCYFFDCREKDLKLDYPKRGKAPVKSLPGADLAARSSIAETLPDRLTQTRTRESEVPIRVHMIYNNWAAAYQPGHEYAPRQLLESRATVTMQVAVGLTSAEARQIVDTWLAIFGLERESFQVRTSRRHMRIDAGDNVEVVITET